MCYITYISLYKYIYIYIYMFIYIYPWVWVHLSSTATLVSDSRAGAQIPSQTSKLTPLAPAQVRFSRLLAVRVRTHVDVRSGEKPRHVSLPFLLKHDSAERKRQKVMFQMATRANIGNPDRVRKICFAVSLQWCFRFSTQHLRRAIFCLSLSLSLSPSPGLVLNILDPFDTV